MSPAWIDALAIGTPVMISGPIGRLRAASVEKITATTVSAGGLIFAKKTGRVRGYSGYDSPELVAATPDLRTRLRRKAAEDKAYRSARGAHTAAIASLSDEQLGELLTALNHLSDAGAK